MGASQGEKLKLRYVGLCCVDVPVPVYSTSKDIRLHAFCLCMYKKDKA